MSGREGVRSAPPSLRAVREPEKLHAASYALLRLLIEPSGVEDGRAGREQASRGRAWRAMRVLGEFDAPLLGLVAVAPVEAIDGLVADLLASGHLDLIDDGDEFAGCPRYRLTQSARALPPVGSAAHG